MPPLADCLLSHSDAIFVENNALCNPELKDTVSHGVFPSLQFQILLRKILLKFLVTIVSVKVYGLGAVIRLLCSLRQPQEVSIHQEHFDQCNASSD